MAAFKTLMSPENTLLSRYCELTKQKDELNSALKLLPVNTLDFGGKMELYLGILASLNDELKVLTVAIGNLKKP